MAEIRGTGVLTTVPKIQTEIVMPPYVAWRKRKRADGSERSRFWFEVPKRLRPEGWLPVYQLPLEAAKRTGLCDETELNGVRADGQKLYDQLLAARDPNAAGDAEAIALHEALRTKGTVPWLIAKFKAAPDEDTPASKWHSMDPESRRNYDYAFRAILAWSANRRPRPHPSLLELKLPHVIKMLNRFVATPSKQRMVKVGLNALFDVARFTGLYEGDNPIKKLPLAPMRARTPIAWPAELVDEICAMAIAGGRSSVALFVRIKWWYGWRTRDIVKIKEPNDYKDGKFVLRTGKRDKWVGADATDDIAALIEATRPLGTHIGRPLVMNEETGLRYNERTLSKHLRRMLDAIAAGELVHVWLGERRRYPETDIWALGPGSLRHTVMTQLEEASVANGASAALVGHSPASHARMKDAHYRIANPRLAQQAVEILKAMRSKG